MALTISELTSYQLGPRGGTPGADAAQKAKSFQPNPNDRQEELEEKFQQFVAGTFYRMWLEEMRKSQNENPLIHGGKAEEIFQAQLDQTLADRFASVSGGNLAGKMFEQWSQMHGSAAQFRPEYQQDNRDGQARPTTDGSEETLERLDRVAGE